jgi:hypothetical protein
MLEGTNLLSSFENFPLEVEHLHFLHKYSCCFSLHQVCLLLIPSPDILVSFSTSTLDIPSPNLLSSSATSALDIPSPYLLASSATFVLDPPSQAMLAIISNLLSRTPDLIFANI